VTNASALVFVGDANDAKEAYAHRTEQEGKRKNLFSLTYSKIT
jgi:hypothetical protein